MLHTKKIPFSDFARSHIEQKQLEPLKLLGLIGGVIAHLWQGILGLGLAVGLSLALTVTIGCALGFLVPFLLIKLGFDQAAGADPIITTIKDMSGLAIYFSSVSLLVPLIAAG